MINGNTICMEKHINDYQFVKSNKWVPMNRNDFLFFVCGLVLQEIRLLRLIKVVTWSTCMLGPTPLKSSTKLSSEASFFFLSM